jgi:two-component system LytT family sensor kinase
MRLLYTLLVLLMQYAAQAQPSIDSVHPLFSGKLDGDKIRETYDYFELMLPIGKPKKISRYNDVQLSIFHSKKLYVKTGLKEKSDIKELEPFIYEPGYAGSVQSGMYWGISAVPLFDSIPVMVTAYGINPGNRHMYRFRVVMNKTKEIIPWTQPKHFTGVYIYYRYNSDGTTQKEMAYLGEFMAPVGNHITIEVKNLNKPDTVYNISAVWIKRAPVVIATFTPDRLRDFINVYKFQWKYDQFGFKGGTYYGDIALQPVDSLLHIRQFFVHDENNLFIYLGDKVKSSQLIEYNLVVNKTDSAGWTANTFDNNCIWLQQLKPGNYTLLLRYAFQRQTVSTFNFSILAAWYQTTWFTIALAVLILCFAALLYNFYRSRKQKKLLQIQTQKRQQAEIGLKSIRSQFNPHFVFNALNSIQGLVHKNDSPAANKYLSEFSQLMRESLQTSHKEMVSIDRELAMLSNYLELEKLRFGFSYSIRVAENINPHATEIPVLLLQPLAENAVKHGISGLYANGELTIRISRDGNDMEVSVTDNGRGFDPDNVSSGFGIRLTKERIALLSEMNPSQPILWFVRSDKEGTTITLTFKNWLL